MPILRKRKRKLKGRGVGGLGTPGVIFRGKGKGGSLRLAGQGLSLAGGGKKSAKRKAAGKKAAKSNRWVQHVKKTFKQHPGISFAQGRALASQTYKRQ